jgi:hypothetical protein
MIIKIIVVFVTCEEAHFPNQLLTHLKKERKNTLKLDFCITLKV